MKKSAGILGVVVVLGIAYTGVSWYMGQQAQVTIQQSIERGNQRLVQTLGADLGGSGLKIAIDDYRRGIFSSDIAYSVHFNKTDGKPGEIKIVDHLQHGPFPLEAMRAGQFQPLLALSHAELAPTPAVQKWFDSLKGQSPLTIVTQVGFGGRGHSAWQFKPLDVTEGENKIAFSGGTIDVDMSNHFKDGTAVGQFDSFSATNAKPNEGLQVKGVKFNSKTATSGEKQDQVQIQSGATIDSLTMASGNADAMKVEKWAINLNSQQQGDIVGGTLRYDFGRIQVGQADLGSVSLGFKGSSLSVKAMSELAAEYDRLQAKYGNGEQILDMTDAEKAVMHDKLLAALASNPALDIDPVVWKNDKGQSTLAFNLHLSSPAAKDSAKEIDALLPQILKQITLKVSVSKPMMVQVLNQAQSLSSGQPAPGEFGSTVFDQFAGKFEGLGLAKANGDKVESFIQYEDGKIEVNGQKMSVMEFAQRAMGLMMM